MSLSPDTVKASESVLQGSGDDPFDFEDLEDEPLEEGEDHEVQ